MAQIESIYSKKTEKQLKDIYADLEKHQKKLLDISNTSINLFGTSNTTNPADLQRFIDKINDLNKKIAEQERAIARLSRTRQQGNQRTSEEIVNQRALSQASERQVRANSRLVGAYQNLNAQHQIASRRLQDLIVRGRTATQTQSQYNREVRVAQRDFQNLDRRVQSADRAVGRFNRNVGNYPRQMAGSLRNLMGAFGIVGGVSLFASLTKDIFQTTKELQSLDNALKQVTGTQEQFSRSQAFLNEISEAFGLEIKGLTTQFTQFYVSAKDKISGTAIENIFRSISKAGATMGLSVDAQNRAFLALNQMMSKGVVSAEELRGQLGEALPGAFGIMAKALNVNEQQLGTMMKQGKLLASDVLPKFAEQLEKTYGIENLQRVETLNASTQRLGNTWTDFVRSLNESETGGISIFFKKVTDEVNGLLKLLLKINKSKEELAQEGASEFLNDFKNNTKGTENEVFNQYIRESKRVSEILKEQKRQLQEAKEIKRIWDIKPQNRTSKEQSFISKFSNSEKKEEISFLNMYEEQVLKSEKALTSLNYSINEQVAERKKLKKEYLELIPLKHKGINLSNVEKWLQTQSNETIRKELDLLKPKNDLKKEEEKILKKQTNSIKENVVEKKKSYELDKVMQAEIGSEAYFENQIASLEKRIKLTAKYSEKYVILNEQLQLFKDQKDAIYGKDEEQEKAVERLNDFSNYYSNFIDSFKDNSGFGKLFDLLSEDLDKFKGDAQATALAVSEAFQEAFNTIASANQQNFNAERALNEERYNVAMKFANGNAEAEAELAKEKERRDKEIARREAKAQKKLAMFNIAINTAQAVLAVIAKGGKIWEGIAVGVMGAAQLAFVANQEIPEFWKGTDNAPEGWAKTDEKGAEIHTDSNGNIKDFGSKKGARMKYLNKGDKIVTAEKTNKLLSLASFNEDYHNVLFKNNILPPIAMNSTIDLSGVESKLDKLVNKSEITLIRDEQGERIYEKRNNATIELKNNRIYIKSRNVR